MTNKRNLLVKLLACVLILTMVPIMALADYQATTKGKTFAFSTNKYEEKYYLGTVGKGVTVTVDAEKDGWVRYQYAGHTCFSKKSDFNVKKVGVYTNKKTTVYATASTRGKVLDTLTADFPLYVVGENGDFCQITSIDGKATGYVKASCLSTSKINIYSVPSSKKISYNKNNSTTNMPSKVKSTQSYLSVNMAKSKWVEYVVYCASLKLGCKYVVNGANNGDTFNNGSFVSAVFKIVNKNVSKKVKEIGHSGKYSYIAYNNLKRGDIVCFECDGTDDRVVDHVGIYLGNGYFIHASATAGCVLVSQMNSGYYRNAFCWGRRVI